MKIRRASAWGFYSFDRTEEEIESMFLSKHGVGKKPKLSDNYERRILGVVVPHAGYVYSGPIASHVYYQLAQDGNPETFVIIGPNHSSYPGFNIMLEGIWRMPMGDIEVDSDVAKSIVKHSKFVDINPEAHDREHSIEVQLPFLQYIYNDKFQIVPITVGYCDYGMCEDVGLAIVKAIKENERDSVVIASTDFTHYGKNYYYTPVGTKPFEKVIKWVYDVDKSLIDIIISLDAKKLAKTVDEKRYTMCGSLPVATMIVETKEKGAKEGKLLKYATSYDTQGSTDIIVGYGAIKIEKNKK
jgi:hypothetical protein